MAWRYIVFCFYVISFLTLDQTSEIWTRIQIANILYGPSVNFNYYLVITDLTVFWMKFSSFIKVASKNVSTSTAVM